MRLQDVITTVNRAICSGEFACLFLHCSIIYSGRAESVLDVGDRLVMIKQDRSVIIHQPEGGMPINYLKAPADVSFDLRKDQTDGSPHLVMHARSSHDEITVDILRVYDMFSRRLIDGQSQELSGDEAEMSDHIRENPVLIRSDFKPVSREEHTKYGFIDVFGHLGDGTLAIVECKRYTAGLSAVTQLRRYVEKMKSLRGIERVAGFLAAPAITENALAMLSDWGFEFSRVDPPKRHMRLQRSQKKIDAFFKK